MALCVCLPILFKFFWADHSFLSLSLSIYISNAQKKKKDQVSNNQEDRYDCDSIHFNPQVLWKLSMIFLVYMCLWMCTLSKLVWF